jgi:peptidoglycan/LPS O-acetylase OafA/YrhL
LISLTYGIIVASALSPSCLLHKLKSKITFIIATLSYAIYLSHKQVFYLTKITIEEIDMEISDGWMFFISLVVAVLGGLLLHLAVEKPFLRLRSVLIKKGNF